MGKKRRYTDEQFINAVKNSISYRQVAITIGLVPKGGTYTTMKRLVDKLNLDTSHFKGQGWNKNKNLGPKRPIQDYLSGKKHITSHALKNRIISEKLLPRVCDNCKLSLWLDKEIPLELHHIDGNNENNLLDNLQLLCPNCHSLTPNYRGKK